MERISWIERKTYEEVLRTVKEKKVNSWIQLD